MYLEMYLALINTNAAGILRGVCEVMLTITELGGGGEEKDTR